MGVIYSISTIKSKVEYQGMMCVFLGYAKHHTGGTYCMLNLRTKRTTLCCGIIWTNKTQGKYVSRKENTKGTSYILQYEDEYYNWDRVNMNPAKN